MANLSNINNILRVSSLGVGINKNNTGPSELDIESAGADMIDMTRTGQKTYRFAISGASAFSLFDVAANADRLVINSAGNATFAGSISTTYVTSGGFTDGYVTWNAAQFNRSGAAIEFQYAGSANSFVKIGAGGSNPTTFNANTGDATFAGNVTSNFQATASSGSININSSDPTIRFNRVGGTTDKSIYELRAIAAGGTNDYFQLRKWNDAQTVASELLKIDNTGNTTFVGNVTTGGQVTVPAGYSVNIGTSRIHSTATSYLLGGNVGIGTASPLALLSVGSGSLADTNVPVQISTSGGTSQRWFGVNKDGSYGLLMGYLNGGSIGNAGTGAYIRNITEDPLYFMVSNSDLAMTILANKNVGIGVASPAAKLDVLQETRISYLQGNQYRTRITNTDGNTRILSDGAQCNIIFGTTAAVTGGTASEKMRIDWQGNVGIGTTLPSKKLEVAGSYKLGTNAYIQYDAGYPYTINMLNTAAVGNLILNAGAGSSGYESKIELQGSNTAGGASITFTTASSQALVIKNGGDLTVSGSIIDANGVRTYRNGGSMNNGVAYTFDITVPNDSGSGTIHHVDAMMTHYDTTYGCLLNCYAYTRGTAVSTQTNLVNQTSTQGGGWFVTKPNSTTLRITKTAGTYVGTGFFQIVVITKST